MIPCTTGAIALCSTGNAQGGHYFFSLTTGKHINRNQWTVLPKAADVVQWVNRLCRRPLGLTALEFPDRSGVLADPAVAENHGVDEQDDKDCDPDDDDNLITGVDDDDDDDDDDGAENADKNAEEDNEAASIDDNLAILDTINNLELDLQMEIDANNANQTANDNMAGKEPAITDDADDGVTDNTNDAGIINENVDNNINDAIEDDIAGMDDVER